MVLANVPPVFAAAPGNDVTACDLRSREVIDTPTNVSLPADVSSSPPSTRVAVIMQHRVTQSRWQEGVWEPVGVLAGYSGAFEPRLIVDEPEVTQWLYPDFRILLQRGEAQGYFHNMTAPTPYVFVLWRMEEGHAVPRYVSVSYDEASRWMDGGAQVDPVVMPHAMRSWVGAFVARHYKPQPKQRSRPQSFLAPRDRGFDGPK